MAGPWEQYAQPAAPEAGPWQKYRQPAAPPAPAQGPWTQYAQPEKALTPPQPAVQPKQPPATLGPASSTVMPGLAVRATLPDQVRKFADDYLTPSPERPPIKSVGDFISAFGSDLADVGKGLSQPVVKGIADLLDYSSGGLEPGKDISDEAKTALSLFASKTPGKPPIGRAPEAPKAAAEASKTKGVTPSMGAEPAPPETQQVPVPGPTQGEIRRAQLTKKPGGYEWPHLYQQRVLDEALPLLPKGYRAVPVAFDQPPYEGADVQIPHTFRPVQIIGPNGERVGSLTIPGLDIQKPWFQDLVRTGQGKGAFESAIDAADAVGPDHDLRSRYQALAVETGDRIPAANEPVASGGGGTPPKEPPGGPGPLVDPPLAGEGVKGTARRVDDALYRVRKSDTADKIEARQFLEGLPDEAIDPKLQEKVYTETERRMIDPKAPLSPDVAAFIDQHLKPWKVEERALASSIRSRLGKDADGAAIPPLADEGYVHRVVQGKGTYYDKLDPEQYRQHDPVAGGAPGRTLSKFASSLQPRKFWVLEDAQGNRTFQRQPNAGWEVGQGFRGTDGKLYRPKLATTEEIEANTGTRYYKNAAINTVDNVLRLRRIDRNLKVLDEIKPQLLDKDLMVSRQGNREIPEGFMKTTLPQFEGYMLDPHIAHVLNDFHGEIMRGGDFSQVLSKINRFLTGSLFWTPIPHAANVFNHWLVSRGWDWIRPQAYRQLMASTTRAIRAVVTQNEDYTRMLREGSGLLYGDVANQNFYKLMLEKMTKDQLADPQTWDGIARELGFGPKGERISGAHKPKPLAALKDMVKWEYRASSKMLWAVNDMFMLQRQFELMDRGVPMRQAIAEAEKDIPNYRIPSSVMGKRWVSEALQSPNAFMFGRYKYGQFRAYSTMIKDLVKGETGEARKEALGKLMVLGALGLGAYPLASAALRRVTGNDKASVMRSGPFSIPEAAYEFGTGEREWIGLMSSLITPAPTIQGLAEITTNRGPFGRPIIEPGSSGLGQGVQAGEYAASKIGSLEPLMEATRPGGPQSALARQLRVKLPTPQQEAGKAKGKVIEKRQAAKRENKDVIERTVKRFIYGGPEE